MGKSYPVAFGQLDSIFLCGGSIWNTTIDDFAAVHHPLNRLAIQFLTNIVEPISSSTM